MTLFAENIPQGHRTALILHVLDSELLVSVLDSLISPARLAHSREIAFDVGHKNRHTALTETFCYSLQSNGLACAGCAGDHSMAICHVGKEREFTLVIFCDEDRFCHKYREYLKPASESDKIKRSASAGNSF